MNDGKCTKRYPRYLHAETITGFPQHRRQSTENGGKCITIKVRNSDMVDNRWVAGRAEFTITLKDIQSTHRC